ncbi:hypothetical protein LSAT2_026798 [Lamellibrachia satsuma]|nr:hypothetical protein LSAT2_026798 [Lamellibrachia satsuma]
MEKSAFPQKTLLCSRRWLVTSLGVYGFVVSLILAASIAGGAFYLSGLKQYLNVCKETRNNVDTTALRTYTSEYKKGSSDSPYGTQKIKLNTVSKTEIFIQNGTVAVFDFLKNIGGFYTAEYNKCFLVGGLDERIYSPDDLKKALDSMKGSEIMKPSNGTIYYKASWVAVVDQSFFPQALAPFCKGRPTFWLTEDTNRHARVKRSFGVRFCISISIQFQIIAR